MDSEAEIKRNITVIRGNSATGKTALVDMIREHFENGEASAVELSCDKECTVLEGRTWAGQLAMMKDSIVFIDEGNEFVMSDDFAMAIQETDNYYVIVTREGRFSLIEDGSIVEILEQSQDYIESKNYFSWERYFTEQLIRKAQDSYLKGDASEKFWKLEERIKKKTEKNL